MKRRYLLVLMFLPLAPSYAQEVQFKAGDAVSLEPDKAYILARTFETKGAGLQGTVRIAPVLARLLTEDELRQVAMLRNADPKHWKEKAAPNVLEMLTGQPFSQANGQTTLLAAARPGTYILAGVAVVSWASTDVGAMVVSLALGTVKFEAKPGVITDLGEILAVREDQPTTIPELSKVVTGKPSGLAGYYPYVVAIRPTSANTSVPTALASLPRTSANYRAMAAFPNYAGANLGRITPLTGILDYAVNGDVVDLKSNH